MKEIRVEAKTVKEAIEKALKELNLTREQVEVEIIYHEKKGILGIGSKKACVVVREKIWGKDDEEVKKKKKHTEKELILSEIKCDMEFTGNVIEDTKMVFKKLLELSNINYKILEEFYNEAEELIHIKFQSKDAGLFLYNNAKGLLALQQIISIIVNKNLNKKVKIKLDIEEFWSKTEMKLKRDVEHAIEFIKKTKKEYKLKPMPSPFRKIIHDIVKNNYPDYTTFSVGHGKFRRTIIKENKEAKNTSNDSDKLNSENVQSE